MKIVLLILIAIGVMAIYDARKIGEKFFSSVDKNKITKILKIIGLIICIICGILLCFMK